MEQKVHLVNSFIRVPMPAEPGLVLASVLNGIKPTLHAVIYCASINHAKEHLGWFLFERAGVRQDDVERFALNLLLHICLDFFRRLFIRPPAPSPA